MPTPVSYSSKAFLSVESYLILENLKNVHSQTYHEIASSSQISAWRGCIDILKRVLTELNNDKVSVLILVFEYELPRERGRRPDVLLFYSGLVFVLEFKEDRRIQAGFIDQVAAYARDLKEYHAASRALQFTPILVLGKASNLSAISDEVSIVSPDNLTNLISTSCKDWKGAEIDFDLDAWLKADYSPLPSLVSAAATIFKNEPLPTIRRAQSAGIPATIQRLKKIAIEAENSQSCHLALITGVPGAGKTLVGLTFVYDSHTANHDRPAVFLSGNGPLVEVLQYALKSKIFVQDVHGFLKRYGGSSKYTPTESVIIFDEAQRAWDAEKVKDSSRGHSKSEPEDFLSIGEKKSWCLLVGLIGEGQEIHIGEESGIQQWNDAIKQSQKKWSVSCPAKLKPYFGDAEKIIEHEELNLTESLRSHLAKDVQIWINNLLDGEGVKASMLMKLIREAGFDIYVTRNLQVAKDYVIDRYEFEKEKRFGLIASAKDRSLGRFGVTNDFPSTRTVKKGPWYIDDPDSRQSCCQLNDVVTEFGCQGLELDFPIVCWGDDFTFNGTEWKANRVTLKAKDNFNLRKNSYRVLLSRGRDGMFLFVPPLESLNETFNLLIIAGVLNLETSLGVVKSA